ncbi:PQ loop repeat-domain-containing protein [Kockovaella imperatae]|uniref:PQ loop repeat-domain-containing protein n=1 Tax=Kockovaella imperatae TaxID=4999 RepID=A0A1Y1UD37_9TREE|nr:PQ loop repeat-domain-containing protein [Kockovaella imperatae]ORX35968.1 PQ loop repeat-domain-containing protein [Kockovaella imperatae]
MSIALWIVVFSPQIWENYQLQSGDGLSVSFIVLWLAGDLTNSLGSIMAHLLPTMIILGLYYSVCDLILLYQVYYYRRKRALKSAQTQHQSTETSPLLRPVELPPATQPKPFLPPYIEYPLLLLFVLGAGFGAWYVTDRSNGRTSMPDKPGPAKGGEVTLEWKSQVLGWASACLYLGSRLPQIAHNYKTRCAGLSLAMFFFSISGNVTYVMSILFISTDRHYLLANAAWLAGSGLTVFLDLFVLAQFAVFNLQDRRASKERLLVDDDRTHQVEAA